MVYLFTQLNIELSGKNGQPITYGYDFTNHKLDIFTVTLRYSHLLVLYLFRS